MVEAQRAMRLRFWPRRLLARQKSGAPFCLGISTSTPLGYLSPAAVPSHWNAFPPDRLGRIFDLSVASSSLGKSKTRPAGKSPAVGGVSGSWPLPGRTGTTQLHIRQTFQTPRHAYRTQIDLGDALRRAKNKVSFAKSKTQESKEGS